jgi:hypothetical protein
MTGDTVKYEAVVGKCEGKLLAIWNRLEAAAVAAGSMCPSIADRSPVQAFLDACGQSVAEAVGGGALGPDPVTCASDLTTCNSDLGTCSGSLGTCDGNLTTCTGDLGTCSTDLTTCSSGTATAADVLAGKTFSSSAGVGVTGTIPDRGAVSITPGTSPQTIAAGYHNGSGSVAGDADLAASNIASGVVVFGVTGTVRRAQLLKTGQVTSYGPSSDGYLQHGIGRSFTDNGDGTVTDNMTGLMWEKKSDNGDIHDKDDVYTWSASGGSENMYGTITTVFLATLNGPGGFAGHTDWRIPNVVELDSLQNFGSNVPATYPAFDTACAPGCTVTTCSCTQSDDYWSSTTYKTTSGGAWHVGFDFGTRNADLKTDSYYVRAVRGGL